MRTRRILSQFVAMAFACFLLSNCAINSMVPGEGFDAEIDLSQLGMRHGWQVFILPEGTTSRTEDLNAVSRGQTVFQKHCQSCHGPKGLGNGPKARELGLKPANLKTLSRNVENYFLVFQINNGKQDMPQWKDVLTAKDTADVTAYIQTLGDGKP